MRVAVKEEASVATREDDKYWAGIDEAGQLIEGADELSAFYDGAANLALLECKFPSRLDTEQVVEIAKMVAAKYDQPDKSQGREFLGE